MLSTSEAQDIGRRNALHEVSDADLAEVKSMLDQLRYAQDSKSKRAAATRRRALGRHAQYDALQKQLSELPLNPPREMAARRAVLAAQMVALKGALDRKSSMAQGPCDSVKDSDDIDKKFVRRPSDSSEDGHHSDSETSPMPFHTTLLAPVRRLPVELLGHIFAIASHGEVLQFQGPRSEQPDAAPTAAATAMRIARTCKYWRDVATGTPVLWARMSITFASTGRWRSEPKLLDQMGEALHEIVPRAYPLPIDLYLRPLHFSASAEVKISWSRAIRCAFFQRALPEWTAPRLHFSIWRTEGLDPRDMASITELTCDRVQDPVTSVIAQFPSLEKLCYSTTNADRLLIAGAAVPSTSCTLTNLALALPMEADIFPVLQLVPCLTVLRWKVYGSKTSVMMTPTETFTLPLLTTFELQLNCGDVGVDGAGRLMKHLDLPVLERLDVVLSGHPGGRSDAFAPMQAALASRVPKMEILRVAFARETLSKSAGSLLSCGVVDVHPSHFAALAHTASNYKLALSNKRATFRNSELQLGSLGSPAGEWGRGVFDEDMFDKLCGEGAQGTDRIQLQLNKCDWDTIKSIFELLMEDRIPGRRSFVIVACSQIQ